MKYGNAVTLIVISFFLMCKIEMKQESELYNKNKREFGEIVDLYKKLTSNIYFFMRINYKKDANEILIRPNYSGTTPVPTINFRKNDMDLHEFVQKAGIQYNDLRSLVDKMTHLRCEEIYKHFYYYDDSTGNFKASSVAVVFHESKKLQGFAFFDSGVDYPSEVLAKLSKISDGVYYFETSRSIFE